MKGRSVVAGDFDWTLFFVYLALVLVGWLSIYSAVYEEGASMFSLSNRAGKQMLWIGSSLLLLVLVLAFNYRTLLATAFNIYFILVVLLILVLIFGEEINGARSWFSIGSFRIQPAEFAKLGTVLALASVLSRYDFDLSNLKNRLLAFVIILVPMVLVVLQNDIGSALVYASLVLVLYREGLSGFYLLITVLMAIITLLVIVFGKLYIVVGLAILGLIYIFYAKKERVSRLIQVGITLAIAVAFIFLIDAVYHNVLGDYQRDRIEIVLGLQEDHKAQGYNLHQSIIAIGSGGLIGKGYLNGTQTKFDFVPEQSTDFIFCTIGEEFGFLGSLVLISLYIILLFKIVNLAERQTLDFARIFAYGVASIIFIHLVVNIGMTIGLVPVIGIPLPFISYGGSSLWTFTVLIAIILKLDMVKRMILR